MKNTLISRENYAEEEEDQTLLKELIDNIKDDEEIVIDENGIKKVKRAYEQY